MSCFIYGLYCPIAKCFRYIGKSKNPKKRFAEHMQNSLTMPRHHHLSNWIRKLRSMNCSPVLSVIYEVPAGQHWEDAEQHYIGHFRAAGHLLTNMTAGGDGNHNMHPEALARMAETLRENYKRPEAREKNSLAQKAAWIRLKATPGFVEKRNEQISSTMLDVWADPDVKAKRLETLQASEVKAKRYANRDTPEKTAIRVEKLKSAWADPARRAKRLELMRSPEYRSKIAAKSKASWVRRKLNIAANIS